MWPTTARLSCALLRAGSLRVTACFRSPLIPSSGFGALPRRLGAVPREVEHLDLRLAPGQPGADLGRAVDRQAVEDEEGLLADVPHQAAEEAERTFCRDRAVQHHPAQLAFVRDGRDQAEVGPLVVDPHLRRAAPGRIAAAAHVIGAQAGLVAPEDGAALSFGSGGDRG